MLLFISQITLAQDKMLNISVDGGVEILKYTPEIGEPKPGGSVTLECQFQHFLTNNFGYGAGMDISYLTANYYISETIETPITDETDAGIPYTLRTILTISMKSNDLFWWRLLSDFTHVSQANTYTL